MADNEIEQRLCRDCRYMKRSIFSIIIRSYERAACTHPSNIKIKGPDPVSGKTIRVENYPYCNNERESHLPPSRCGIEGRNFEPENEHERQLFQVTKKLDRSK